MRNMQACLGRPAYVSGLLAYVPVGTYATAYARRSHQLVHAELEDQWDLALHVIHTQLPPPRESPTPLTTAYKIQCCQAGALSLP